MGGRNINEATEGEALVKSLSSVIVALCADYGRRESAILSGEISPRTKMEYKYINHNIYEGAAEIVGERFARLYIDEIGYKVGYAYTAHPAVSETEYKLEKRAVRENIARRLHLWD